MSNNLRLKSPGEIFVATESRLIGSYQRCEALGLTPHLVRARDIWKQEKLTGLIEKHAGLVSCAHVLFARTFQWLFDQRTIFILTDAGARIITIFSNPEDLIASSHIGVCLGGSLSEESLGTNAVSLALHDLEPTILSGNQHFCRIFDDWHCVAIPLMDANNRAIGCLGIFCHEQSLGEKLALANLLVKELEIYCQCIPVGVGGACETPQHEVPTTVFSVRLTERQKQTLVLFSRGLSYKQIAKKMDVQSVKAIENHLDAVRRKLAVASRRECIQKAIEMGLL